MSLCRRYIHLKLRKLIKIWKWKHERPTQDGLLGSHPRGLTKGSRDVLNRDS